MSFASTLYLCPILDLLTACLPDELQPEIRLGLQEALVNAAKHGNKLDPNKTVVVQFTSTREGYSWVITDEGAGFPLPCCREQVPNPSQYEPRRSPELPHDESENGRGLCMLYQIFDQVHWNTQGTQLKLYKQIKRHRWQFNFN